MTDLTLLPTGPTQRLFAGAIPAGLHARWCALQLPSFGEEAVRAVVVLDLGDDVALSSVASPEAGGTARLLLYIPPETRELRVELLGVSQAPRRFVLSARPVSRIGAGIRLVLGAPRPILRAVLGGRAGWGRRVRAALAQASAEAPPPSYGLWTNLFDHWSDDEVARLMASSDRDTWPTIRAVVMCAGGTDTEAARATLRSLDVQAMRVPTHALAPAVPLAEALTGGRETYVAILQAGEIVPRHATALAAAWIARNGAPAALCADEDVMDADGERDAPLFKPEPNRALMLSGTLTRGLWLFRRDVLPADARAANWAEALRLELWLRLHETGRADGTRRIPFVLAHRRADAEAAPPAALAEVAEAHFARLGAQARITAQTLPLSVRPTLPRARERSVALIVPSALRAAHVRRCLRAVLDKTDHAALELLLVVSQTGPLDAVQRATIAAIGDSARVRVLNLPVDRFNYSAANNFGASQTDAEFLCLLNDDVAPLGPGWLDAMLGHFADPGVAAAGAKLLYENQTVQHGGIVIGLAGLAEHINRGLPGDACGYAHRAVLSQELSAVTGACLLTRRSVYEAVGGMDESFPIAFNDVDFCLRLREGGHRIVFCAEAELTHYESLSLGHHFSGERANIEREEVRRMRQRWAKAVAADPFHNPNLSLTRGQEWRLAFPPRARKSALLGG